MLHIAAPSPISRAVPLRLGRLRLGGVLAAVRRAFGRLAPLPSLPVVLGAGFSEPGFPSDAA